MTPARWTAACALGCALIAATLLPPALSDDDPYLGWQPQVSAHLQAMEQRAWQRRYHAWHLERAYRTARGVATAERAFGSRQQAGPQPLVWFDSDVPESVRVRVRELVGAEQTARGTWRGKGAVGLMVVTDTATTLDGVHVFFSSGATASTQVLTVAAPGGERCVVVVRLGRNALAGGGPIAPDGKLQDACAFFDAFGAPGAQIAAWLSATHFTFARRLSFAPDTAEARVPWYAAGGFWAEDAARPRCAGGDAAACRATLLPDQTRNSFSNGWWGTTDLSVPSLDQSMERSGSSGFDGTLMESLVRDLGPERFQRMWQSSKALPDAYFDATGQPLASWLRERVVGYAGPYHLGPLPTPPAALLSIVTIVLFMAVSVRMARRPAVA
jgi:hypothetical protein